MVYSLEKVLFKFYSIFQIGDGLDATPSYIFKQKRDAKEDKEPSNLVSGVAYGTKSMLSNVFSAVTGVITEPVKGAKQGGMKGMSVGIGKGFLGLVCKPMKGTIDLVTKTTRGISNTPKTVYVSLSKMAKRVPTKKKEESKNPNEGALDGSNVSEGEPIEPIDPEDDIFIGAENGENIYISKKALRDKIESSQILSSLIYESQRCLNADEQA